MLILESVDPPAITMARIITSAIAPVFLLNAIGTFILILTNRLQRITDRVRGLEVMARPDSLGQLAMLARRGSLIRRGMTYLTIAAHLVCAIVVVLFVDFFLEWQLEWLIAGIFILALLLMVSAINCLLREVMIVGDSFPSDEP